MSESFDYDSSSHISGAKDGNLYHYGHGAHVSLKVSGQSFTGYDYKSGSHFSGKVNGGRVQVYDYGTSRYFDYSV
jgi:hypothetical protein